MSLRSLSIIFRCANCVAVTFLQGTLLEMQIEILKNEIVKHLGSA